MVVTLEQFLAKYPRFLPKSAEEIQAQLDVAKKVYAPSSVFGEIRDHAICLVAAHFLEMDWLQSAETLGVAVQVAAGGGGGSPTSSENDWLLTTWGRQFKYLRDGLIGGTISDTEDDFGKPNFGIGFII
jgi:hypothetical protein